MRGNQDQELIKSFATTRSGYGLGKIKDIEPITL